MSLDISYAFLHLQHLIANCNLSVWRKKKEMQGNVKRKRVKQNSQMMLSTNISISHRWKESKWNLTRRIQVSFAKSHLESLPRGQGGEQYGRGWELSSKRSVRPAPLVPLPYREEARMRHQEEGSSLKPPGFLLPHDCLTRSGAEWGFGSKEPRTPSKAMISTARLWFQSLSAV